MTEAFFFLKDQQIEDLRLINEAHIEVFSARRYQHQEKILIHNGRILQDTFLYIPMTGRMKFSTPESVREVNPGQMIMICAGQAHGMQNMSPELRLVAIHAHIIFTNGLPDPIFFERQVFDLPDQAFWLKNLDFLVHCFESSHRNMAAEILRMLFCQFIMEGQSLNYLPSPMDTRVEKAISIFRRYPHQPYTLEQVADQVGLSGSQFRLLFKREVGVRPKEYQNNLRLEASIALLDQKKLTIKGISQSLGFSNAQHFNKNFKATYGITPGEYRQGSNGWV